MSILSHLKRPENMIRIGFAALAIGGLMRLFFHPRGALSQDLFDGTHGFLTGVTIAAILLGLWKQRRQSA